MSGLFFCPKNDGLPAVVKIAIHTAGYMIRKNNPELVKRALPVAEGIQETLENGGDNGALNALVIEAIKTLALKAGDPLVEAAIVNALSLLKIDLPGNVVPAFSNQVLTDMVDAFIAGLKVSIPAE